MNEESEPAAGSKLSFRSTAATDRLGVPMPRRDGYYHVLMHALSGGEIQGVAAGSFAVARRQRGQHQRRDERAPADCGAAAPEDEVAEGLPMKDGSSIKSVRLILSTIFFPSGRIANCRLLTVTVTAAAACSYSYSRG